MDLIHQIYGTHCTRGTSALEQDKGALADRVLGYSVRASSLEGDRLRECYRQIEPLLYYYLPRDCPAEAKLQHTASSAPKRLVYVPSSDGWEILFQVCYRQTDTAGRPGSYFAHILARDAAKQPGAWSVLDCLRLWEAPHWVTEDSSNIPLLLKPLRSLQEMLGDGRPNIDDGLMLSFLTTEANGSFHDPRKVIPDRWCQKQVEERQQVFSALFSGLLGVLPHRYERALIAVEPALATLLFYGILRLVPRRALPKDTSFSTYEPKPDRKRFSLVATCFGESQETDLPRDWCNPADFVLNTYSGRGCPSQECVSPYVEFMVDRLLYQGWEGVDELIRRFDDLPHGHLVDLDRLAESERASAALPVAVPPDVPPQSPVVPKPPPAVDDKIDPYHEWLGIPPRDQPPHHYRLLGIIAFESNPTLIENAACNRIDRLRTFQTGQHSALSQRLINEVEAAKVCLLDPARKAAYDQQLRQQMQPRTQAPSCVPVEEHAPSRSTYLADSLGGQTSGSYAAGSYNAEISRVNPTCFLFLVDQSGSMAEPFGGESGKTKAQGVADAINGLFQTLVSRCSKGAYVLDRYYIGVIGYGSVLSVEQPVPVSVIAKSPRRIEQRMKRVENVYTKLVEEHSVNVPIWFEPRAQGKTLMCAALQAAHEIISGFINAHPACFPPIIINITDGMATDGFFEPAALNLWRLASQDGNVLLFNIHISARGERPILFPSDDLNLSDEYARRLFTVSSPLPKPMLRQARVLEASLEEGARGFAFNADLASVLTFLDIGTRVDNRIV